MTWLKTGAIILLLVLLVSAPFLFDALGAPFYTRICTRILIFALAASALNLVVGMGGMVSLGHAAFVGTSSYVVAILSWHAFNKVAIVSWPFEISGQTNALIVWPVAILASALASLVIGAISLRTAGLYFIMITLAFSQMAHYYAVSLQQYGGDDGLSIRRPSVLPGLNLGDRITLYYVTLAVVASCLLLLFTLSRSRFGLVIQGLRQNETRMRAIGISPYAYRLTCFMISGAISGVSGVLLANLDLFVSPTDLSLARSSELMAMILIGGLGSFWGPSVGSAFYIVAQFVIGNLTTHWALIFGPLLVIVVLYAHRGLIGLFSGQNS